MKRLLIVLSLAVFSFGVLLAQSYNDEQVIRRFMNVGNVKTALRHATYTQTSSDTTASYRSKDWKQFWVFIHAEDSCSMLIKVATSFNDTTYTPYQTVDSAVTSSGGAGFKCADITSSVAGATYFRMVFGHSGTKTGTTTPYYTAILSRKSN
jgi:hypothetical protein